MIVKLCHAAMIVLLFSTPVFAQLPPNTIYRDPCVEWGSYDYDMGSATLIDSTNYWGGPANLVSTQLDVYDSSVCLARFNLTVNSTGQFSVTLAQQFVPGALTFNVTESDISRATEMEFVSEDGVVLPLLGWTPYPGLVFMVAYGGVNARIDVEIEQNLGGGVTNTVSGYGLHMDYFRELTAVYEKN